MSKKRIAILIDWFLPGTKAGGPVRSIYSLLEVMKGEYDFGLITTNKDLGSKETYKNVPADQWMQREGVSYFYFSEDGLNRDKLNRVLTEFKPDLIYLNSFWSVLFSISMVRSRYGTTPVLLAPRGMLSQGALSIKPLKKKIYLFVAKLKSWYNGIAFHATQDQERSEISNLFPRNRILIAPNMNSGSVRKNVTSKAAGHLKLFYLSRISPVKNLRFALEVLSRVESRFTIVYDIFGNLEDNSYWLECQQLISALPSNVKVTYKRELAFNEVQEVISGYHCLLLPTLNENFGHSIVESLLSGCPVIISDQTPWNDVEETGAGFAIPLAKPEKFASAINEFAAMDEESFRNRSGKANAYILLKTDIQKNIEQYKFLFDECIKN